MKNAAQQKKNDAQPGAADDLGKVQEILFGAERRSLERGLSALGDRLDASVERLHKQWSERLDTFENRVEERFAALSDELAAERTERRERLIAVGKESQAAITALRVEHQGALEELRAGFQGVRRTMTERKHLAKALGELASRLDGVAEADEAP